jgi:hypothetical protein
MSSDPVRPRRATSAPAPPGSPAACHRPRRDTSLKMPLPRRSKEATANVRADEGVLLWVECRTGRSDLRNWRVGTIQRPR